MTTYTLESTVTWTYTVEAESLEEALERLGEDAPDYTSPDAVKIHLSARNGRRLKRKRLVDHY